MNGSREHDVRYAKFIESTRMKFQQPGKVPFDMHAKEKNFPVVLEDGVTNEFHAPDKSECSGEFSIGPVSFKSKSRSSDNSSSIIGGVLAGGAVAIGAVAVTLTLLGAAKNS